MIRRLRFYQTYDKYGKDSEIELQYQEDDSDEWEAVEFVRVKKKDEAENENTSM